MKNKSWQSSKKPEGVIFNIQRFSIHDGPGIRTTIFLKGCPLSCQWCHNPEGIAPSMEILFREHLCIRCGTCMEACPESAISLAKDGLPITDTEKCGICGTCTEVCLTTARELVGSKVTVDELMIDIEKDAIFYDESGGGVTFSGGEPLQQPLFLSALLQACKEKDIHTAIDTSGYASSRILEKVARHTNLLLYDLKLMDDVRHRQFTGVSNVLILENLQTLSARGCTIIVRIPVIPGINDDDMNLLSTGEYLSSLEDPPKIDILSYHTIGVEKYRRINRKYRLLDIPTPPRKRMEEIAERLRAFGLQVSIGGQDHE